jgi:hypothetical protein
MLRVRHFLLRAELFVVLGEGNIWLALISRAILAVFATHLPSAESIRQISGLKVIDFKAVTFII